MQLPVPCCSWAPCTRCFNLKVRAGFCSSGVRSDSYKDVPLPFKYTKKIYPKLNYQKEEETRKHSSNFQIKLDLEKPSVELAHTSWKKKCSLLWVCVCRWKTLIFYFFPVLGLGFYLMTNQKTYRGTPPVGCEEK